MDRVKIKGYSCAIVSVVFFTFITIDAYTNITPDIIALLNGADYVYFDPKQPPILLFTPVFLYFDFLGLFVLLPYRRITMAFMQKLMVPVAGMYGIFALLFGLLISLVISFYPLGTDYYKCDSTSVISSGSHYAKSKEMCKAKAWKPSDD